MTSSLIPVITTIAEVGALAGLIWQLFLNRKESRVRFLIEVYESQEDKLNRTLDDVKRLQSYADKRGIGLADARERILATIDINDAFRNYMIHKGKLVGKDLGERFILDIKGVLGRPMVSNRWEGIKKYYPQDFQDFIDS